jgi:hypothetical protein
MATATTGAVLAFSTALAVNTASRILPAEAPGELASRSPYPFAVAVRTNIGRPDTAVALQTTIESGPDAVSLTAGDIGPSWPDYLAAHQGAPVGQVIVSLTLTGNRTPITISQIRVEKRLSQQPLAGTYIGFPSQGETEAIKIASDLDQPHSTIVAYGENFQRSITLPNGQQEIVTLTLTAARMSHRWVFAIDYTDDDGSKHTVFINCHGNLTTELASFHDDQLFTITGPASRYGSRWTGRIDGSGFNRASAGPIAR